MLELRRTFNAGTKIDWGFAEALAFGTLVHEGNDVRLSGEDVGRGTFSHRHAILYDANSGEEFVPLQHIREGQGKVYVFDSLLSEFAILGYEFGYSVSDPLSLVLWEAQFGDFANGAQVIIDQFIAASEAKWQQPCDLVLLLPHGYEGQGPEHSSAVSNGTCSCVRKTISRSAISPRRHSTSMCCADRCAMHSGSRSS
jgi:2-oxoglutarate dehydrogenase complex dehydrogenase (E1) component-like enzyme